MASDAALASPAPKVSSTRRRGMPGDLQFARAEALQGLGGMGAFWKMCSTRSPSRVGIDTTSVVCCLSRNVVDPAALEHVEAAAGSSHKGRLHARLCSERSKAGCRQFSPLPAPRFPGDEAIAYHITGALLLRLLMHGIL